MEQKVQTYVKSLCLQNQKCKDFITQNNPDKAESFLKSLQNEGAQEEQSENEEGELTEESE
jgi:hypothetical protein